MHPDKKNPVQGHLPALDGIRGLAMVMVLCVHFFTFFTPSNLFEKALFAVSGYGTLAIDLFFMLSGLLITGILMDTKGEPAYFKSFFIRRLLRIFPLYYLVLAIIYGGIGFLPDDTQHFLVKVKEAQPWTWTYMFNFFIAREGAWTVPYIGHFWSLAVEEQFYLFWPLAVFWLSSPRLAWLCGGLIAFACLFQLTLELRGVSGVAIHVLTPCRLNALCIGAWLAQYLRSPKVDQQGSQLILRRAWQLTIASIVCKIIIVLVNKLAPDLHRALEAFRSLSWLGLFAALHMAAISADPKSLIRRVLQWPAFIFLGQYSYGIYIFHHFISWPVEYYGFIDWLTVRVSSQTVAILLNAAMGISVSVLFGWLSYHLYEKKFLKLKDVLAPRKSH